MLTNYISTYIININNLITNKILTCMHHQYKKINKKQKNQCVINLCSMKDIKVVNVCSMKEASSIVVGIGINWSKNMCSNSTYMIWYMQHKRLKLFKLTWIGAKVLVMDLTYILSLISSSREKKKIQVTSVKFNQGRWMS